jgi:hypothetical protein
LGFVYKEANYITKGLFRRAPEPAPALILEEPSQTVSKNELPTKSAEELELFL